MKMPKTVGQLEILHERRLCKINGGSLGYFHCWEHFSKPVEASLLMGGAPAGVYSKVYAIVETPDGSVHKFLPEDICFVDEEYKVLYEMNRERLKQEEKQKCQ